MAKKEQWIVRTDGSTEGQAARPTGAKLALSVNGRSFEVPANEPFEPTPEQLEVLQASYYNINGQVQKYTYTEPEGTPAE